MHAHGRRQREYSHVRAPSTDVVQSPPMHIGTLIFPTDLSIRPDRLASELEEPRLRVAVGDRAHAHPDEPPHAVAGWPGPAEEYRRTLDPFVALAAAATVTERLRLGPRHHARRPARSDRAGRRSPASTSSFWPGRAAIGIGVARAIGAKIGDAFRSPRFARLRAPSRHSAARSCRATVAVLHQIIGRLQRTKVDLVDDRQDRNFEQDRMQPRPANEDVDFAVRQR